MLEQSIHALGRYPLDGGAEAGKADGIVTAGLELVRHEVRLYRVFAHTARAPFDQRPQLLFKALANVKRAGSERAHDSLMSRHGEEIEASALNV